MAFFAVFVALKIAHRAGGYAVWSWVPTICDLRRPEHHLVQLKKSVITDCCRQGLGDAGVLGPNGWHELNRNGSKTPKTGVFWGLETPNYNSCRQGYTWHFSYL